MAADMQSLLALAQKGLQTPQGQSMMAQAMQSMGPEIVQQVMGMLGGGQQMASAAPSNSQYGTEALPYSPNDPRATEAANMESFGYPDPRGAKGGGTTLEDLRSFSPNHGGGFREDTNPEPMRLPQQSPDRAMLDMVRQQMASAGGMAPPPNGAAMMSQGPGGAPGGDADIGDYTGEAIQTMTPRGQQPDYNRTGQDPYVKFPEGGVPEPYREDQDMAPPGMHNPEVPGDQAGMDRQILAMIQQQMQGGGRARMAPSIPGHEEDIPEANSEVSGKPDPVTAGEELGIDYNVPGSPDMTAPNGEYLPGDQAGMGADEQMLAMISQMIGGGGGGGGKAKPAPSKDEPDDDEDDA